MESPNKSTKKAANKLLKQMAPRRKRSDPDELAFNGWFLRKYGNQFMHDQALRSAARAAWLAATRRAHGIFANRLAKLLAAEAP